MAIPEFGTRVPGQIYRPRPGAYGVVRDAAGRVAVVHAPNGCFLPGGGIDGSENPIDALSREIREECGFQAGIGSLIGQANEFVPDWEKQCAFYHARFGEPLSSGPVETDHRLEWLPVQTAIERLKFPSQKWAVSQACNYPVLHTPRLLMRPWRDEDLPAFAAINADPRVMEHFPKTRDRAESDAAAAWFRANMKADGFGFWAVEIVGVAPFIGFVGLANVNFQAHFTLAVEIGWRLAREHWGNGYASEAARAAIEIAFNRLKLEQIVSFTIPANIRSRRVMERLGMTHNESDDFDHPNLPVGHRVCRHVLYRLRRADWQRQTAVELSITEYKVDCLRDLARRRHAAKQRRTESPALHGFDGRVV